MHFGIYAVVAFIFFMVIILAMAIGYLVQRKTISGSCGGISSLGLKKVCDCPEPCERKKARMAKEEQKRHMHEEHRII